MNKSKGAGLDGISSRLILDCADLIASHISIIFNSCLAKGIFPDDWKSASVTPLRYIATSYVDNYRPISVISIIGLLTRLLMDMFLRPLVILLSHLTQSLRLLNAIIQSLT